MAINMQKSLDVVLGKKECKKIADLFPLEQCKGKQIVDCVGQLMPTTSDYFLDKIAG